MPRVLLVDGSSYLYRAFYATLSAGLSSPSNLPTGAIHGVLNMLRRLHKDYPSEYRAVVFDAQGKTFRHEYYAEYKANRAHMPDELRVQVQPLQELIVAQGWCLLNIEGVEADDVIGTLTQRALAEDMRVLIATGDKDLAQLVTDKVTLINTMNNEVLDSQGVYAKFGVSPKHIVDYLTLVGDTSDNVPGVSKVGPKTAVKWLQHYGSLADLIKQADELSGVVGENLRAAITWLETARHLITIRCDVPLDLDWQDLQAQAVDVAHLRQSYQALGFNTWLHELNQAVPPTPSPEGATNEYEFTSNTGLDRATDYRCITDKEALIDLCRNLAHSTSILVEAHTTREDTQELVGISLADTHIVAYIPFAHGDIDKPSVTLTDGLPILRTLLQQPSVKIGHHLKRSQHVLADYEVSLSGGQHDTLLQSYVLESHLSHDRVTLLKRHLNRDMQPLVSLVGKGVKQIDFSQVPLVQACDYAHQLAAYTLRLHEILLKKIEEDQALYWLYQSLEIPLSQVLYSMEQTGVLLDTVLLLQQGQDLSQRLAKLEAQAHALVGQVFNLASPKQLQSVLFERFSVTPSKKTPQGGASTDEEVLQALLRSHPLPELPRTLLEHRGLAKLKSTYVDKLPRMLSIKTKRVHTRYLQAVAITGRLASVEPNLQNIPIRTTDGRRVREAFIAPQDYSLVSADYSQIELRIMAHLSQDTRLLNAFANGEDIHRATAAEILGIDSDKVTEDHRRMAKTINFGLLYGMSAFGLAQALNSSRWDAQAYIERYFARYPAVRAYMEQIKTQARTQGFVSTHFGRRLWVAQINDRNSLRRMAAERAAINAPMQGTAADIIKRAMIAVQAWLVESALQSRLIMQVHDELILEVPNAELDLLKSTLPHLMSVGVFEDLPAHITPLSVPLLVNVGHGKNWEEAH